MISENSLNHKIAGYARRLDVDPPQLRIVNGKGKDPLGVRFVGNVLRITSRAMEELSESELDFGIALSFAKRIRPSLDSAIFAVGPLLIFAGFGIAILLAQRDFFVDNFLLGFGVMFGMTMIGYIIGSFVVNSTLDKHRVDVYHEALLLTGNASAAETYLIRCQTEHIMGVRRRMSQKERENLDRDLLTLRDAAKRLGIVHRKVVPQFD
ncbi:MAG: hypothetical protein ABL949_02065 [Fimbriimonadaceae bacterium]